MDMLDLSNEHLLAEYEKAVRNCAKKNHTEHWSLRLLALRREVGLRMIEDDTNLFVSGKKAELSVSDIENMPADKIKDSLADLQPRATEAGDFIVVGLLYAQSVWLHYLRVRETEGFASADDEEKAAIFKEKFPEFFNKYPVITKYMIYRGIFSLGAFKQFLLQAAKLPQQRPSDKEKMERWCDMRAHYVKNTWRDMHKGKHLSQREYGEVYQSVYRKLMEDYKNFEDEKTVAKEAIEENENLYKKDTIEYLIDHFDELDDEAKEQAEEVFSEMMKKKYGNSNEQ